MSTSRIAAAFSLLAVMLPAVRAQATAAADPVARAHQDIASLIPTDTVAVARLQSIDQVLQYAIDVAKAVGKESNLTADRLLGQLSMIPGKHELIDLHLPIVLAVSLPRATPPAPVLLLPTTDAAAYAASLAAPGMEPVVAGSYVAVPLGGKYVKPAAPSQVLAQLPDGAFALYADAEKIVAAFGMVIGTTLSAAKVKFAQQLELDSPGVDGETLAETYLDGVRAVLGCAKSFRFRADYREGQLELFATLQVKPGSDMDGWSSPRLDAAAGGPPTGRGALDTVIGADWQKLWPRLLSLLDRVAEAYPKATADRLRELAAAQTPLYAALGPFVALDGDVFAADGFHLTLRATRADVGPLLAAVDALCKKSQLGAAGIEIGAPRTTEASGATITDRVLTIDPTKLADAVAMTTTGMENITHEQILQAVLGGTKIPLRIVTKNGRAVVAIGAQADAATMAAVDGAARPWSKPVQEAFARVADCNPLVVQRIDFGALVAAFARLAHQLDENLQMPEYPPGATAAFVFAFGIRDAEWRGGVSIDVAGAAQLFKALR
jgi:hypothetical protein